MLFCKHVMRPGYDNRNEAEERREERERARESARETGSRARATLAARSLAHEQWQHAPRRRCRLSVDRRASDASGLDG